MSDLRVYNRISEAVGNTPMVRLGATVSDLDAEAFAKLEFMNPMGSVKDRIARHIVEQALAEGHLHAGGVVLEASSGNTAMGLAMMAVLNGLTCRMVVRQQTSPAKLDCLRALGVELVLVDGDLPPEHPESYNRKARRLAEETGAYFPDQHNNRINNEAHYRGTGPEIWRQMEGRIDAFVCGIGTGGTISGVGRYLKEQDPAVRIVAVDIEGSVFTEHFKHGRLVTPFPSFVEGLGDEEVIDCPEFELFDDMVQVGDADAFRGARQLAREEAIFVGGSAGAALCGVRAVASELTERLGRRPRIATLFADSGSRYLTTVYNDDWMRERGFLEEEKVSKPASRIETVRIKP